MDNSGKGRLQVPGFGDIPLTFELPCQDRFTHGVEEWCQTPAVTLREFAMTAAMNRITDQDYWYRDVHNEARLNTWRRDAMARSPLISDQAWDWCVSELQDKARFFLDNGFVECLDAGSVVCKSGRLPRSQRFAERLQRALEPLQAVKTIAESYLVDPCLYSLVYGHTEVLDDGGTTTISHQDVMTGLYPISHKLTCASVPPLADKTKAAREEYVANFQAIDTDGSVAQGDLLLPDDPTPFYWSSRYQSLPCEVSFTSEGVSIRSYVNNLHPSFRTSYSCLEELIAASIMPWNQCLTLGAQYLRHGEPADLPDSCVNSWDQTQRGRKPLRIVTFGVQFSDGLPSWAIAFDDNIKQHLREFQQNTERAAHYDIPSYMEASRRAYADAVLQLHPIPEPTQETFDKAWKSLDYPGGEAIPTNPIELAWAADVYHRLERNADAHQRWLHPEPGTAITYSDWRDGRNVDRAVVEMDDRSEGLNKMPTPLGPTHAPYELRIQNEFREQGVQVIVTIGSIDLDPVSCPKHQQPWHLQGLLNEHIVATSLYIYQASNVVADISFRQETPMQGAIYRDDNRRAPSWVRERSDDQTDVFRSTRGDYQHGICGVFGLPEEAMEAVEARNYLPLYETGQIELSHGRLVAFPNILESRIGVELLDKTRPGQLAYVMINLVDPHYRICSTANVPPQQPHWNDAAGTASVQGETEASSHSGELAGTDEMWLKHRANMKKECQWLNMARYSRMISLGWDDFISGY